MRNVGIEIEVESASVSSSVVRREIESTPWELDLGEGSLRGGEFGWEIKTASARGLPLEEAVASLRYLYPIMVGSSGCWRAAVHVHVDVRDLTGPQQALALCAGYALDSCLFAMTSPERVESNFCVPLAHKFYDVMRAVEELATSGAAMGYGKYSSININCLPRFGTFEFRHMKTPETGSTVESVQAALLRIESFARAAALVIDLARWPTTSSYEDVLPSFIAMMQAKYLLPDSLRLSPDPMAISDVVGRLSHTSTIDPLRYPLPAIARALNRSVRRGHRAWVTGPPLGDLVGELGYEEVTIAPGPAARPTRARINEEAREELVRMVDAVFNEMEDS